MIHRIILLTLQRGLHGLLTPYLSVDTAYISIPPEIAYISLILDAASISTYILPRRAPVPFADQAPHTLSISVIVVLHRRLILDAKKPARGGPVGRNVQT